MLNVLHVCHKCSDRQSQCNGPCPCTIDGIDIIQHATQGYCPLGKYHLGLGDTLARFLHLTGLQPTLRQMMTELAVCRRAWMTDDELAKPADCGCKSRQLAINA